jgi:hypothetical protein
MHLFDIATNLRTQLFGSREDFENHALFLRNPSLLGRLISKLTYAVRDAAPRFMAVDLARGGIHESFDIVVYTDDHVIQLVYDPTVDHITTSIVSRKSIRRIDLLAAPNFMGGDVPGTYRGGVAVQVFYNEITVRLPGDNHVTEQNREALDSFIVSLMRDLANR